MNNTLLLFMEMLRGMFLVAVFAFFKLNSL